MVVHRYVMKRVDRIYIESILSTVTFCKPRKPHAWIEDMVLFPNQYHLYLIIRRFMSLPRYSVAYDQYSSHIEGCVVNWILFYTNTLLCMCDEFLSFWLSLYAILFLGVCVGGGGVLYWRQHGHMDPPSRVGWDVEWVEWTPTPPPQGYNSACAVYTAVVWMV